MRTAAISRFKSRGAAIYSLDGQVRTTATFDAADWDLPAGHVLAGSFFDLGITADVDGYRPATWDGPAEGGGISGVRLDVRRAILSAVVLPQGGVEAATRGVNGLLESDETFARWVEDAIWSQPGPEDQRLP